MDGKRTGRIANAHGLLLRKAYDLLDECALPAIKAIINLLESKDENIRLKAANAILSRVVPEVSSKNGDTGGQFLIQVFNYRPNGDSNGHSNGHSNGQPPISIAG